MESEEKRDETESEREKTLVSCCAVAVPLVNSNGRSRVEFAHKCVGRVGSSRGTFVTHVECHGEGTSLKSLLTAP